MSVHEHKSEAPVSLTVCVVTVSDTRDETTDTGGRTLIDGLTAAGHTIGDYRIVKDDLWALRACVCELIAAGKGEAIIVTGGSGIGARDVSYEALAPLWDKHMPGFGEYFRALSVEEIGSATVLSRAEAGVAGGVIVALIPGSRAAVRLALSKILLPELPHMLRELRKDAK